MAESKKTLSKKAFKRKDGKAKRKPITLSKIDKIVSSSDGTIKSVANKLGVEASTARSVAKEARRAVFPPHGRAIRAFPFPKNKKEKVLDETGTLECEVCGFDFKSTYGELGDGFAECHHTKPISELMPGEKTKITDLSIVCANCHRMIHRSKPWLRIEELKQLMQREMRNK